jgi:heterodisulfide reductase subunit A
MPDVPKTQQKLEHEAPGRSASAEKPRIGVYLCDCGGNISDTVSCQKVTDFLAGLPDVAVSRGSQFMCSDAGQKLITDDINEKGINRVVVGACSIFLHEQTFRKTLQRAGLNPYLYCHIGVREQDSWVHHSCPREATEKAARLMAAGVAKARMMRPLEAIRLNAEKHVLVIGGGVAGLRAALSIARRGLGVTLVEKSDSLGGHVTQWNRLFPTDEDARSVVSRLIADVMAQENIEVLTGAEVISSHGYVGNFEVRLHRQSTEYDLKAGAVVIATGFEPYEPFEGELGYRRYPEVITLPQLEGVLSEDRSQENGLRWNNRRVRSLAMIHCVGSRQVEGVHQPQPDGRVNDYCSRVCCTATLAAANEIRERYPEVTVYDVYQDIRTYGRGHENYYLRASRNQVTFLRYTPEEVPEVVQSGAGEDFPLLVRVKDRLTWGEEIELPVDLVVLSVGIMPSPVQDLEKMFKVAPGSDRFLLEVHPKLRPVETAVAGVVLAGTAQAPMSVQECCAAAEAAASKAGILLARGEVELEPYVARVDIDRCQGTGECVRVCPQEGAIRMEVSDTGAKSSRRAVVTAANCNGCGVCVSACPNRAIDVQGWQLDEYEAMVQAMTAEEPALETSA